MVFAEFHRTGKGQRYFLSIWSYYFSIGLSSFSRIPANFRKTGHISSGACFDLVTDKKKIQTIWETDKHRILAQFLAILMA